MKTMKFFSLIVSLLLVASHSWAQGSVEKERNNMLDTRFTAKATFSGGGGALIEAAFRLRAQALIAQIENSPSASALCSAESMRQALTSKIRIVDQLIDPATGQPPTETNLDAWTIPGDMQLLNSSWTIFFKTTGAKTRRSVDVLILHEVYRATKSCDDERFVISDKIFSLLEQPKKDTRILKLGYQNPKKEATFIRCADEKGKPYDTAKYASAAFASVVTICDQDIWAKSTVGKTITCFSISDETVRYSNYNEMRFLQGKLIKTGSSEVTVHFFDALPQLLNSSVDESWVLFFQNLLKGANTKRPFYMVYDMEFGNWSYGFNTARLNRLE